MTPYLSIVVAARNDNYGGDFRGRLQAFLTVLGWQLREHSVPAELVVVEWNPPPEKPPLSEAVRWPGGLKPGQVRVITVPKELHDRVACGSKVPMFEYPAKNVGLRRARGEHVLVTNPDVILSDALVQELARRNLERDGFYRIDRFDYRAGDLSRIDGPSATEFASRRVVAIQIRPEFKRGLTLRIGPLRRWRCRRSGSWPGTRLPESASDRSSFGVVEINDRTEVFEGIHTNAAGDFMLTARENWHAIRGFWETAEMFTHLDSYGSHQLRALGLDQLLFVPPCMLFHAEHGRRQQQARPKLEEARWEGDLAEIRAGRLGPALNDEDWGLAGFDLDEAWPGVEIALP